MAVTATDVRPLAGSVIKQFQAGAAVATGNAGYIAATGKVSAARANAAATTKAVGIIVAVADSSGLTTAADTEAISLVTFGPVGGFSSLTPGAIQYISSTAAGVITETAPAGATTWTHVIGYAMSATVLFVQPGTSAPTSNV